MSDQENQKLSAFQVRHMVDIGSASAAAEAADTLAAYLEWKRPDLEESVVSIRGLGAAIRQSLHRPDHPSNFRHAVVLVDQHHRPMPVRESLISLAMELLSEYGEARGGTATHFLIQKSDYGRTIGYAMEFVGGPTDPIFETRLKGEPTTGTAILDAKEEIWKVSR